MKVSFCVTCMNRLWHLQQTLRKNMKDNPTSEFIVVDYSSKEPIRPWIKREFSEDIASGRMIFIEITGRLHYDSPHAKNIAHAWGTGDILCNLDADNYLGYGFAQLVTEVFKSNPNTLGCSPDIFTEQRNGTHGRVALHRDTFLALGGYDEALDWGWGFDDYDLINRALAKRCQKFPFPNNFMETMSHSDDIRVVNVNFSKLITLYNNPYMVYRLQEILPVFSLERLHEFPQKQLSVLIHQIISNYNIGKKQLIANNGKRWAEAEVTINMEKTVRGWIEGKQLSI